MNNEFVNINLVIDMSKRNENIQVFLNRLSMIQGFVEASVIQESKEKETKENKKPEIKNFDVEETMIDKLKDMIMGR